jgi:hypothetical protein
MLLLFCSYIKKPGKIQDTNFYISMSEQTKTNDEFLQEFNWHNFEEGIDPVDEQNLREFETLVEKLSFQLTVMR